MAVLTTPIHGLPYPDGAERVMDGDNAIQGLAYAVERELEGAEGAELQGVTKVGIVTPEIKLPCKTLMRGDPAYLDAANDQAKIPPGKSGMYLITVATNTTNTVSWARSRIAINGTGSLYGQTVRGISGQSAISSYTFMPWLAVGDTVAVVALADPADAADIQLWSLTLLRWGGVLGTLLEGVRAEERRGRDR